MDTTAHILDMLTNAPNVDSGVNTVLEYLGNEFRVSRVYIFENTDDLLYTNNTYEWCAEGVEPMLERLQNMSISKYSYDKFFEDSDVLISPDIEGLPPATRDELRTQGIKAIIQCEILEHGSI